MDVNVDIYRSLHIGLYVCMVVKTILFLSRRYVPMIFVLRENEEYIIVVSLELCVENRYLSPDCATHVYVLRSVKLVNHLYIYVSTQLTCSKI